MHMLDLL